MRIKFKRNELIDVGNYVGLMPTTDEGWIYLARKITHYSGIGVDIDAVPDDCFMVKYLKDGSIRSVVLETN
jgi:hypothetical protein